MFLFRRSKSEKLKQSSPGRPSSNVPRARRGELGNGFAQPQAAAKRIPSEVELSDTYSQAALGFRCWRIDDDGGLVSYGRGETLWEPGSNNAECKLRYQHAAPHDSCCCGLYACHTPGQAISQIDGRGYDGYVIGVIAARGKLCVHQHGYRAQEAAIIAIAPLPGCEITDKMRRAEARYNIELVETAAHLGDTGRRFAAPVPDNIKPQIQLPRTPWSARQDDEHLRSSSRIWMDENKAMLKSLLTLGLLGLPIISICAYIGIPFLPACLAVVVFVNLVVIGVVVGYSTYEWLTDRRDAMLRLERYNA